MKLLRTVTLVDDGRVYEVDLCDVGAEVGADAWVVNVRHGRRGAPLTDGSKTVVPVGRVAAERIFERVVAEQTAKGYRLEGALSAPPEVRTTTRAVASAAAFGASTQRARLVARLGDRRARKEEDFDRAIWRAGELRLREAEAQVLALIGTGTWMRDYCAAYALGRLGSPAAIAPLEALLAAAASTPPVKRITTLALQALYDDARRARFDATLAAHLPDELGRLLAGDDENAFEAALSAFLLREGPAAWGVVDLLYAIDKPVSRPAIRAQLRAVPLEVPYFYFVRHVFKAAEYRRDAVVFGLLAHRFETTRASFDGRNDGRYGLHAYGSETRRYLRRRVWRTLRRAGELADPEYVRMAVGVLLPFADDDADEPLASSASPFFATYGRWASYWAFNGILFGRSQRYAKSANGNAWRLAADATDEGIPEVREESFPALWDAQPEGCMHLLAESQATPVHHHAVKILRANAPFLERLEDDDVAMLLERPFAVTAAFGFALARTRAPSLPLVRGLTRSLDTSARATGAAWIEATPGLVLAESAFLAELVGSRWPDVRLLARRVLAERTLAPTVGAALVARVVAWMLGLSDTPEDDARARDATATLVATLAPLLATIGTEPMRDLLAHPASGVQELGAELLLRAPSADVPEEALAAILRSPFENVRAVGMRLLEALPDASLARMELLLARLSADKNPDLRAASRPLVARIATRSAAAAETITRALVEALLRRKLPEGAPAHLVAVLKEELRRCLDALGEPDVLRLLLSASPHAMELGGLLLQRLPPDVYDVPTMVKLGSSDVLAVRQAAWRSFELGVPRVRANMAEAARLLDASWEDTRAFAFRFFRDAIGEDAFTADVLVTILDSVRPDVQAFGRALATKHFREEHGPVLMEKLAEHPSLAVQTYTTNYLARYATDRVGALEALVPYFTTVLSRPSQGRLAKKRVLAFLAAEGQKHAEAARVVVPILHRAAATSTIELRAAAIAAMVDIHRAQPDVVLPLRIDAPPVRERAARGGGAA